MSRKSLEAIPIEPHNPPVVSADPEHPFTVLEHTLDLHIRESITNRLPTPLSHPIPVHRILVEIHTQAGTLGHFHVALLHDHGLDH